jgi:hypothetical protein
MITIPYITILIALQITITYWRINNVFDWQDWTVFTMVLTALTSAFIYSAYLDWNI